MQFKWAGEELVLLHQKAIYWPERSTIIITDPHFGKAATFRSRGIPLPLGTTDTDLQRLTSLLKDTKANRLVMLGDFFHAKEGKDETTLASLFKWRREHHAVEIHLVPGNHDRHAGPPPADMGIMVHGRDLCDEPFCFTHHPTDHPDLHVMSGHVHPAISLRDVDGSCAKIPCFLFQQRVALLPAFGGFTGTAVVIPGPGDQVFAVGPDALIRVPSRVIAA